MAFGGPPSGRGRPGVHPVIDRAAAYSWRILVIAALGVAVLWLIGQTRVAVFPVIVALFLTRALHPVAVRLRRHGWRPGLAAVTTLLGFLAVLALAGVVIVPTIAGQFSDLGPTVNEAIDHVEDWLVDDSPFDVSREDVQRLRDQAGERLTQLVSSSGGAVISGATLLVEILTGLVLALLLTFFMLKDGDRFVAWVEGWTPDRHRTVVARSGARAWDTLGGYLRGAALLGVVEGTIIGLTLFFTGAGLAIPIALLTFAAAFVPILGAITAGVVAVLVALVTASFGAAITVAIVALLVQQFDNDLLAPVIYGRSLQLHPVVILLSLVAGGALFGIPGTFLAVPVTAVVINVASEVRSHSGARPPAESQA